LVVWGFFLCLCVFFSWFFWFCCCFFFVFFVVLVFFLLFWGGVGIFLFFVSGLLGVSVGRGVSFVGAGVGGR